MSANYINSSVIGETTAKDLSGSYTPRVGDIPENGHYQLEAASPTNGKRGHNNPGCSRYDSYENDIPGAVRGWDGRRPRGGASISECEEYIEEMPSASRGRRMDGRSHMYEELPSTGYENGVYEYARCDGPQSPALTLQSTTSQLPLIVDDMSTESGLSHDGGGTGGTGGVKVNRGSSTAAAHSNGGYRKRINPLYCSLPKLVDRKPEARVPFCFAVFLPMLAFIVAVVACVMAGVCFESYINHRTYEFTGANSTDIHSVLVRLTNAEYEQRILIAKLTTALDLLDAQRSTISYLNSSNARLIEDSDSFHRDVNIRLENISKMSGPQGLAGAGNLSACAYYTKSAGNSIATTWTNSSWIPSPSEAQNLVITGVACTTEGGAQTLLRTRRLVGYAEFQCGCTGTASSGLISRYCSINYWTCPLIS